MANLISKRYAQALFEAGLELNKLKEFKDDFSFVTDILYRETELRNILSHPKVSKDEKKKLLNNIFNGRISIEILNFLYVLVDKRRESEIMEINREFIRLFNEHENLIEVTAITSVLMDDNIKNKLRITLENKLNKKVQLKNVVDKNIIGGVLLNIGNKVIDGTVKGQLLEIEKAIKGA